MTSSRLEGSRPYLLGFVSFLTIILFAVGGLPWTLDDYDQAKQAFISAQMVGEGRWFYQTTPGETAGFTASPPSAVHVSTKPPAVGWFSAGVYLLARSWDFAWHFPAFLSAILLAVAIYRAALRAFGAFPALVALAAFALNMLSIRLASLVRTDMPLALITFLLGWLMWEKIRNRESWRARDQLLLFVGLTAALFIKGPVAYAFLLPPLVCYQVARKWRPEFPHLRINWWPWIASLGIFLLWVIVGVRTVPGFLDDVVLQEFLGRFTEKSHRFSSLPFYFPHLLEKFAPWSLLIAGLALMSLRGNKADRGRFLGPLSPESFWLVAWALGGLLVMTIIPSKRVDRIYPIIPPLCLMLGWQIKAGLESPSRAGVYRSALCAIVFAILFSAGYCVFRISRGYQLEQNSLDKFGREVRRLAAKEHLRYEVVKSADEGLLLYLQRPRFVSAAEITSGSVACDAYIAPLPSSLGSGSKPRLSVEKKGERPVRYGLFLRGDSSK